MAAKPVNVQAGALVSAASTVAAHVERAAAPGAAPIAKAGSPVDAAAASMATGMQTRMAAMSAQLTGEGPQLQATATAGATALQSQDAQNGAKIGAVPADMRSNLQGVRGGGVQAAAFGTGAPLAPASEPGPSPQPVDMPTGHVVVCEPYTAGGGFVCWEWYLDGSINGGWSPTDRSGGWP